MNRDIRVLDNESFKEIYTNEKLRNAVAYAHGVEDGNGNVTSSPPFRMGLPTKAKAQFQLPNIVPDSSTTANQKLVLHHHPKA